MMNRNYYRCSSSKGCSARKQVERSNADPNIFIITYTGDHTHPRPTHRNSLAGSTRNKFTTTSSSLQKPDPIGPAHSAPAAPCSSSTASLSPTTPLTAPIDEEVAHHGALLISEDLGMDKESEDLVGDDEDNDREEEDEDDLLIPNVAAMSEEIFMGFRELGRSPASGDNFSSGPGRADFTRFSSAAAGAGGGP